MAQAGKTRKSVLGIKEEVAEGTLVLPSASTDFTALQEGFSLAPSFEELTSAELVGSIGQSRSVLGFENPEMSFSHYLRGSGVEGQAPDYALLMKAAFGDVATQATERTAQAASTVSLVKLSAGQGAEYERGKGVLVKKSGGYEIRNVLSVSGDDLSLAQDLANATGLVGAGLGKPVLYKPADEDHPSLSMALYRGNGHNIEAMSGARVTEMSASFEAGQFINGDFSLAGIRFFFNPIEITASTDTIDWTDDAGTWAVAVTAQAYKDPHELAAALQVAMNATTSETISVAYSNSTGKFTISTSTSAVLSLLWNTGANAGQSIGTKLGFSVAADDTGATSYLADNAMSLAAPATPNFDDAQPLVCKNNEVFLGDSISCFGAQTVSFTLSNTKTDIPDICEESGRAGSIISAREATVEITALLSQYDAERFHQFHTGDSLQFTFNAGEKSGGNWIAGKCINLFIPSATITSFEVTDVDGLVAVNMSLRAYVADGLGEVYWNFL